MYSSNEEMLSKVKSSPAGTYDIVVPTDYMVETMINQGLLAELDKSKLPNYKNLSPAFLNPAFDPQSAYSVPYLGGMVALCVNKSLVGEEITSYNQIFDPKYADSIVALDDFRMIIGVVAKSMGYSGNETDPAKLEKIRERLMELKPNIKVLDSDSPKTAMINEETSIGLIWSAEVAMAQAENPDIQIVFPKEGHMLFLDNMTILKDAKNPDAAAQFINYILDPEVSKTISEEFPYINPNAEAVKLLGDDYINNPACNVPEQYISEGEYVKNIDKVVDTYSDMWAEFVK